MKLMENFNILFNMVYSSKVKLLEYCKQGHGYNLEYTKKLY